jgi:hypothetical protein
VVGGKLPDRYRACWCRYSFCLLSSFVLLTTVQVAQAGRPLVTDDAAAVLPE